MSSYLLLLETVINTIVSLLAAAIALFDPALHAVPQVERISLTRARPDWQVVRGFRLVFGP